MAARARPLIILAAALLASRPVSAEPTSPPPAPPSAPGPTATTPDAPSEPASTPGVVEVRGAWQSPRGLGDVRVSRALLQASPRQHTAELLSAAPGFFVDHEDGEGLGNDVYLRGFDLEHGSGIEMTVGGVPVNQPAHVLGQGYADVNFVIPEVVRSVRVQQGTYDPRQGDSAIVGSAHFDLGVVGRGYRAAASYGSFDQVRLLGIAAPDAADDDTFVAVAVRKTDGFGDGRAGRSGAVNAQYGLDLGSRTRLRVVSAARHAEAGFAGVVRQDDVAAGRIGYYDRYPYFAEHQGATNDRALVGVELTHGVPRTGQLLVAPWAQWTELSTRQNYSGALQTSRTDPRVSGLGDLFELRNRELAAGGAVRYRIPRLELGRDVELVPEPGLVVRVGRTEQQKRLLDPATLRVWDPRADVGVTTVDLGAHLDLDVRVARRLRISGGPRADLLVVGVDDRLASLVPIGGSRLGGYAGPRRDAVGAFVGPRVAAELQVTRGLAVGSSYGEGFRSLDAAHVRDGDRTPFSRVRSAEVGLRAEDPGKRFRTTLALFETRVANELVFVAEAGGFETEGASVRRGVTGSVLARPAAWLLASSALSVTDAVFVTRVPGISHHVPNVPPLLFRGDAIVRRSLLDLGGQRVEGRLGIGYTFLSGRYLTDAVVGPASHVVNGSLALRRGVVELSLDAYNLLGLRYADSADVHVSNFSTAPGQQLASRGTHFSAAPPRTLLATLTLYL